MTAPLLDAIRLLSDPDTAARLGEAAQHRSDLFTWRAVVQQLFRALEEVPSEPRDASVVAA